MRMPNLLVLGVSRSGTTSLHTLLGSHPSIFMSRRKEIGYFNRDRNWQKGRQWYARHFAGNSGAPICGESTPLYFEGGRFQRSGRYVADAVPSSIERIAATLPDARFVVILRDPIERIESIYWKNLYQGKLGVRPLRDFLDADMAGFPSLIDRCRYDQQIEHFFRFFDPSRLHVCLFDEYRENPVEAANRVCGFLGLPPAIQASEGLMSSGRRNSSRRFLGPRTWHLRAFFRRLEREFERDVAGLHEYVAKRLHRSVARTGELVHRDLSHWLGGRNGRKP